jgi:colanic acid biosynthesis glycosyl transferase WcaI
MGAKAVMHIQDFEIDAMFGLGMVGEGKISGMAKKIEKWLMRQFDAVSTISYSMIDNAKNKGLHDSKLIHFPNWSDTDFVTPQTDGSQLRKQWDFAAEDKIIVYAGNIGNKQGLEIVLEAAKHFEDQPEVKFVLVGAGAYVETLKSMSAKLILTNVWFKPLQPWENVPQMLALADIHLVVQKKGAADAVLPSKLTNILSAGGHALVTAEPHTELGAIAEKHKGIFTCVAPENPSAFIAGLTDLLAQDLSTHNAVAREFAELYLAKAKILDQFVVDLENLIKKPKYMEQNDV